MTLRLADRRRACRLTLALNRSDALRAEGRATRQGVCRCCATALTGLDRLLQSEGCAGEELVGDGASCLLSPFSFKRLGAPSTSSVPSSIPNRSHLCPPPHPRVQSAADCIAVLPSSFILFVCALPPPVAAAQRLTRFTAFTARSPHPVCRSQHRVPHSGALLPDDGPSRSSTVMGRAQLC